LKSLRPKTYKEAPETLGEHLRKHRLELGLLQKDVAKQLRADEWAYLKWEQDRTKPTVRFIPGIIAFLGYDPFSAPQTLWERIRSKRRQLGLSQERLAKLLGVDEGTLRHWERGQREPVVKMRAKIDRFLEENDQNAMMQPFASNEGGLASRRS
jgi:transcriptional regulator with XRE-family HTH domain